MPLVLATIASGLLLVSLKLPLWQMRMEAPQYRDDEALRIAVHPNTLRGDLDELAVLNQYIGVHVPRMLPQFKWLPGVLIAGAVLGLAGGALPGLTRRWMLVGTGGALAAAMLMAAIQAKSQMYDIGHKRDQKTILAGVQDFTPPFLGTTKVAQFTVSSRFGAGAWLIGAALALQLGAAWVAAGVSPAVAGARPAARKERRLLGEPSNAPDASRTPNPVSAGRDAPALRQARTPATTSAS